MKIAAADLPGVLGETLGEVAAILEHVGARFAVIGGLAVSAHSEARATKDIDLAVVADAETSERLTGEMSRAGFAARMHGPPGPGAVIRFSRTGADGITRWVDLLFAGTPFEERAVSRARLARVLNRELPIASVEDLLVYKLVAGRPQDVVDAVRLWRDHSPTLDRAYLDATVREWELDAELERIVALAAEPES